MKLKPETKTEEREIEIHHDYTCPLVVKKRTTTIALDDGLGEETCSIFIEQGEMVLVLNPTYAEDIACAINQLLAEVL